MRNFCNMSFEYSNLLLCLIYVLIVIKNKQMKWPSCCFVCLNLFIFPPCQHGVVGRVKESFTTMTMSEGNSKFASWQKHNILWRYIEVLNSHGYLEVIMCIYRFNKMERPNSIIPRLIFFRLKKRDHFNKPIPLILF